MPHGLLAYHHRKHHQCSYQYDELEGAKIPFERITKDWETNITINIDAQPHIDAFDIVVDFPSLVSRNLVVGWKLNWQSCGGRQNFPNPEHTTILG